MDLAYDRRDVVLAMRFEADVLQYDDFVIPVGVLERALQERHRILFVAAEELVVGADNAVGGAKEPFAPGVVAGPADQRAHRLQRLVAGRPADPDGLSGRDLLDFGFWHGR